MAKQPETKFKEKVLPRLRDLPISWWFKSQQVALRGIPDILGVLSSNFVALELKATPRDKPTALQVKVLRDIELAGGFARVVHPENFEKVFDDLRLLSGGRAGMMSTSLESTLKAHP